MVDAKGVELQAGDLAHVKRGSEWVRVWVRAVRVSPYGKKRPEVLVDNGERWDVNGAGTATLTLWEDDSNKLTKFARAIPSVPLAPAHTGMRVSAIGVLERVRPRAFAEHVIEGMQRMAESFYAGDLARVDAYLQALDLDQKRPKANAPAPEVSGG